MTAAQPPAIIIGGGDANGLGIARNLGSQGIPVYCLTSNPHEPTRYSKYCAGAAVIPQIEADPKLLHRILARFHRRFTGIGVLFPTTDTALLTVSTIREMLDQYVTTIPKRAVVETMVIKTQFYPSLRQYQVPHPVTLYLHPDTVRSDVAQLAFPVFVRPAQSLLFTQRFGVKGFVARHRRELRHYLRRAVRANLRMMVQEVIPGPARNGFALRGYIDSRGRAVALMATQKIRQPTPFSNVTINRSVPLAVLGSMKEVLLTYLQQIGYRGLFGAEFKWDARDHQFKLLEVNARSMGGNYFGTQCGINHIEMAYRDALGSTVSPVHQYAHGIYKIKLLTDLPLLLRRALRRQLHSSDLRPYLRPRVTHIRSRDDPLPFLYGLRVAWAPQNLVRYVTR